MDFVTTTYGVDVVEQRWAVVPGHFSFTRQIGQSKRRTSIQRLQAVSKDVHRLVKQGRFNLSLFFEWDQLTLGTHTVNLNDCDEVKRWIIPRGCATGWWPSDCSRAFGLVPSLSGFESLENTRCQPYGRLWRWRNCTWTPLNRMSQYPWRRIRIRIWIQFSRVERNKKEISFNILFVLNIY